MAKEMKDATADHDAVCEHSPSDKMATPDALAHMIAETSI